MAAPEKEAAGLQKDIANLLQRQLALASEIGKAYQSHVGQLSAITKTLAGINGDDLADKFGKGTDAVTKLTEAMKGAGSSSQESFGSIFSGAAKGKKSISGLSIAFAGVTGGVFGFAKALKNVWNVGKAGFTVLGGIASSVYNIAAAIVSVPLKIYENLIEMSNKFAASMTAYAQAVEDVRKEFGTFKGPVSGAVLSVSRSMKGFSDTGLSTWRVFGNMAERMQWVRENATAMGATLGVMTAEFKQNGGAWAGYQKGLGLSGEEMKGMGDNAIATGQTMEKVLRTNTKYSLELGKAFNLDAKLLSRDMGKAMKDVGHFAGATVKQIGQASTYARKLGVELDKIVGTLDQFETFDTAAENTSKLSQAFGVTVDAMKLMKAQSPDEQIDILKKSFQAAGKSTDDMNRQQIKYIQNTTGLSAETVKLVFSNKNMGVSLDSIKQKGAQAEKKTLTQAEALKKLSGSIERMVKQGPEFHGFIDAFLKGFGRGIFIGGHFYKLMSNIRRSLMAAWREGRILGVTFVKAFPGVKMFADGLRKFFEPKHFKKMLSEVRKEFERFVTGKASFSDLMEGLKKRFTDFFNVQSGPGRMLMDGARSMLKAVAKIFAEGIRYVIPGVTKLMRSLTAFIKDPKAAIEGAKSGGSFVSSLLSPIIDALSDPKVTGGFGTALGDLFYVAMQQGASLAAKGASFIYGKISDWLSDKKNVKMITDAISSAWEKVKSAFWALIDALPAGAKIAAVGYVFGSMFVSAIGSAILAAGTAKLISSTITKALGGAAAKEAALKAGEALGGEAKGGMLSKLGSVAKAGGGVILGGLKVAAGLVGASVASVALVGAAAIATAGVLVLKHQKEKEIKGIINDQNASIKAAEEARANDPERKKRLEEYAKKMAEQRAATFSKQYGIVPQIPTEPIKTNEQASGVNRMLADLEESKKKLDKFDVKAFTGNLKELNEKLTSLKPIDDGTLEKLKKTGETLIVLGNVQVGGLLTSSKKINSTSLVSAFDAAKKLSDIGIEEGSVQKIELSGRALMALSSIKLAGLMTSTTNVNIATLTSAFDAVRDVAKSGIIEDQLSRISKSIDALKLLDDVKFGGLMVSSTRINSDGLTSAFDAVKTAADAGINDPQSKRIEMSINALKSLDDVKLSGLLVSTIKINSDALTSVFGGLLTAVTMGIDDLALKRIEISSLAIKTLDDVKLNGLLVSTTKIDSSVVISAFGVAKIAGAMGIDDLAMKRIEASSDAIRTLDGIKLGGLLTSTQKIDSNGLISVFGALKTAGSMGIDEPTIKRVQSSASALTFLGGVKLDGLLTTTQKVNSDVLVSALDALKTAAVMALDEPTLKRVQLSSQALMMFNDVKPGGMLTSTQKIDSNGLITSFGALKIAATAAIDEPSIKKIETSIKALSLLSDVKLTGLMTSGQSVNSESLLATFDALNKVSTTSSKLDDAALGKISLAANALKILNDISPGGLLTATKKIDPSSLISAFQTINVAAKSVSTIDEPTIQRLELTGKVLTELSSIKVGGLLTSPRPVSSAALMSAFDAIKIINTSSTGIDDNLLPKIDLIDKSLTSLSNIKLGGMLTSKGSVNTDYLFSAMNAAKSAQKLVLDIDPTLAGRIEVVGKALASFGTIPVGGILASSKTINVDSMSSVIESVKLAGKSAADVNDAMLNQIKLSSQALSLLNDVKVGGLLTSRVNVSSESITTAIGIAKNVASMSTDIDANMIKKIELTSQAIETISNIKLGGLLTSAKKINTGAIIPAFDAIKKMIKSSTELDSALSDTRVNKFNMVAKLKNVAESLGLGANAKYTIKNKDVAITLNLTVTMDAGEVEKVILQRKESVIRDRLINAQYTSSNTNTKIPNNPNSPPPKPMGGPNQ